MSYALEIKNLETHFETREGVLKAVNNVSFNVPRGSVFAIVGESGCGKSMTALSILRLIQNPGKIVGGSVIYNPAQGSSVDLLTLPEEKMRHIRGNRIAMIFQEPMTSLNPVFKVGEQIAEAVRCHQNLSSSQAWQVAVEMLAKVGIPNPAERAHAYPHEMSGGMRQRVMIAMALSCNPDILIADEPTTALDVTIQAQILDLIHKLIAELGLSLLLITHDFGIVAEHAQQVAVMYAGEIVETAPVAEIFKNPRHPYTAGLLKSIPSLKKSGRLYSIPGTVPSLAQLPAGCFFQDRCERKIETCVNSHPELEGVGHAYRCFNPY